MVSKDVFLFYQFASNLTEQFTYTYEYREDDSYHSVSKTIILQSSQSSDNHVIIYPTAAHLKFLEIISLKNYNAMCPINGYNLTTFC